MAEYPQDLISEILRLLPVSTLLRFKCVSKSFHSIIDSPNFIDFHLNATSDHRTRRRQLVLHNAPNLVPTHVLNLDDPFQPLPDFLLENPLTDEDSGSEDSEPYCCRFYGHCNGLVLTVEQYFSEKLGTRFRVWNPSTRKYWKLQHQWRRLVKYCSFGYDPCTDDYKVLLVCEVKVYERPKPCECCFQIHDEIWMLGLRSGCWNKIGNHNPSLDPGWHVRDVCFVDGEFYFVLDGLGIYAINVLEEKLSLVSLPNDISKETHDIISVQVLDECLCVGFGRCRIAIYVDYYDEKEDDEEEEKEETKELYVRKKNDDGEFFWTKLVSFAYKDHFSSRYFGSAIRGRELGYSKRRDKLFIVHI